MTRQQVVDAIKAAIRATGIPAFEWVAGFTPNDLPALVVRDTADEIEDSYAGATHHLTIEVDCFTASGAATISDNRALMAQVAVALSGVTGWQITGTSLDVQQDENTIARGTVAGVVRYVSKRDEI